MRPSILRSQVGAAYGFWREKAAANAEQGVEHGHRLDGGQSEGREGSLVTLICDSGDRYASTYCNSKWLEENRLDIDPYRRALEHFLDAGEYGGV